jgi:hypothetical protein
MGAGWQIFKTISASHFTDKETEDAVAHGEAVSFWGGRPLNRYQWAARRLRGSESGWRPREESK